MLRPPSQCLCNSLRARDQHGGIPRPRRQPLHRILAEVYNRYRRPLFIGETSHVGVGRAQWLREVAAELWSARDAGIPVEGVCLFPIIDRMDWNDETHWHNSGLWDLVKRNGRLERVLYQEYADELRHSQALLARCGWGDAPKDDTDDMAPAVRLEPNAAVRDLHAVHGNR